MSFGGILKQQLESKGFLKVKNKANWYWRPENPILYLLCIWEQQEDWQAEQKAFTEFAVQMKGRLEEFHCTKVIALSVLVDKNGSDFSVDTVENSVEIGCDPACFHVFWQFSMETGKIIAPKGQPDRLLGIEKLLFAAAKGETPEVLPLHREADGEKPFLTAAIFVICVLLLVYTMFSKEGDAFLTAYGLSRNGILAGEYYRFLTSMFLHGGIMHLVSNGVYLYYFGVRTEKLLGKGRYLLLYLVSGVCGGVFSILTGNGYGISIGASGAIYGLLGAMLLLTRKRGAVYTGMSYGTMLLLALTAIGLGFFEPNVDNMAHIGGLLGGIAVFGLFLRKKEG